MMQLHFQLPLLSVVTTLLLIFLMASSCSNTFIAARQTAQSSSSPLSTLNIVNDDNNNGNNTVVVYDTFYNTTCKTSSDCNGGQYVCIKNRCSSCESSSQCELGAIVICKPVVILVNSSSLSLSSSVSSSYSWQSHHSIDYSYEDVIHQNTTVHKCVKKGLWPLRWQDIAITALCFVGGSFAASAGIGGGGIYVPAMLLIGGYSAQVAVPLSTVMIFGCAIANFLMLAPNKHPNTNNRPVINYTAALIFQPIILCGSTLGVMLNAMIPNWFLVVTLFVIVSYTTYKTTLKGLELRRKENQAAATALANSQSQAETDVQSDAADQSMTESPSTDADELNNDKNDENNNNGNEIELFEESQLEQSQEQEQELAEETSKTVGVAPVLDLERQQYPVLLLVLMGIAWIVVFVVSLLNGSKKAPSLIGIKQCSPTYFILWAIQFPLLFGYSMLIGLFYHSIYKKKIASNYQFEEGDIRWTRQNTVLLPCLFLVAGLVAGLLGIGGGEYCHTFGCYWCTNDFYFVCFGVLRN